jgi:hypothetical protein
MRWTKPNLPRSLLALTLHAHLHSTHTMCWTKPNLPRSLLALTLHAHLQRLHRLVEPLTLTRSVGLATVMAMAPVARPEKIFRCSGTSPTWSLPTKNCFTCRSTRQVQIRVSQQQQQLGAPAGVGLEILSSAAPQPNVVITSNICLICKCNVSCVQSTAPTGAKELAGGHRSAILGTKSSQQAQQTSQSS